VVRRKNSWVRWKQVGTTDGKYLRRAITGRGEPTCVPMYFHKMQARLADSRRLDYSALVLPEARWEGLDPIEFERLRRIIRESRGQGDTTLLDLSDIELAKTLGAVEANHDVTAVRVLGLLMFGREEALVRLLPTHEMAFQVLAGTQVEVNDFFRWPLLRLVEESQTGRPLGLDELLLLNHLWQKRRVTTSAAARLIQKSETEARAVLERLVENGLVEARGERKGRSYHLSAATYRRLGAQATYVRQRGFEPLRQEQMVLQYVQAHLHNPSRWNLDRENPAARSADKRREMPWEI